MSLKFLERRVEGNGRCAAEQTVFPVDWLKDKLLDIAEDGVISDDELSDMQKILEYFNKLEKTASELKIIAEKAIKGAKTV